MNEPGSAVAVFGGTFDPVHIGHTETARYIADLSVIAEVRMIPSNDPPHRRAPGASAEHRLKMLEIACAGDARLVPDAREILRGGTSYTIDTLTELRAELDGPLYFVIGVDAFCLLSEWHRWQQITDLAHILVVQRPGSTLSLPADMQSWFDARRAADISAIRGDCGQVVLVQGREMDVSATCIRDRIAHGSLDEGKLADGVVEYIRAKRLYGK